jgi:hypothetical protein
MRSLLELTLMPLFFIPVALIKLVEGQRNLDNNALDLDNIILTKKYKSC